jgi:hypothetical protein
LPDPRYYIAGLNLDLALQIEKYGFKGLLVTQPCCVHKHMDDPVDYRKDRYDRFGEGAVAFRKRWGTDHKNLKRFLK